jgi:acetyl esterase/lipase
MRYLDAILADEGSIPDSPVREHLGIPLRELDGYQQTIDIYERPAQSGPRPALLCLHGGGWQTGNTLGNRRLARFLAWRFDIVVASASYRLIDRALFPAQIQDAANAMRWLRAHAATWDINPQQLAVTGSSAGGYLAAMIALTHSDERLAGGDALNAHSAAPQAVIVQWGPLDFIARWYGNGGRPGAEKGMLGTVYTNDPTRYHFASALSYVTAAAPPALFVQGRLDPVVHLQQGELGAAAWQAHGVEAETCFVDRIGHGETDEQDRRQCENSIADFLQRRFHLAIHSDSSLMPTSS